MKFTLIIATFHLLFLCNFSALADVSRLCEKDLAAAQAKAQSSNAKIAVTRILESAGISPSELEVNDPAFYAKLISDPTLQLGTTYIDGMWDSPDLSTVLSKLMSYRQEKGIRSLTPLWRTPDLAFLALIKNEYRYYRDLLTNRQTRTRSSVVAEEHYDAGNELYRRMLDPTLTYTSGIWAEGYNLEDSQNAKYDLICRKLGLKQGDHVLDIGSGFGGFARFAARNYGVKVTGITISVEQLKAARAISADYKDVNFLFSDYRDIPYRFPPNTFDHVVSIEMIEAVGPKNLKELFQGANASLKDGGRFLIQGIAKNNDAVNTNAWINKYIFQDGVAPSTNQVDNAAKDFFGAPADRQRLTEHYVTTLEAWSQNFERAWPDLASEYGPRFKRMWDFYLASVKEDFRVHPQGNQLYQTLYVKGPNKVAAPVRELPSRQQLDSMRTSDSQKEIIAQEIGGLEIKRKLIKKALAPRPTHKNTPLPKDARIAIIGAGPSGLSTALEFQKLGYSNVVVIEKELEAGGKSHTVNLDGRFHDMGATMGIKISYSDIQRFAEASGQKTIPFPKEIFYNLKTGTIEKQSSGDALEIKYQGLLYLIQYLRTAGFGERGLEIPPAELADPWQVVMNRHGMGRFGEAMRPNITGYGYDGPETPAVYPIRMIDANAILGAALMPDPKIMWENGTQPIWKGVASGLNVRTKTEVEHIQRNESGVYLSIKGASAPERFDKVVLAIDPKITLKILDATEEEKSLFSLVQYTPYATFAVRVEGFSEGQSQVGYLRENMSLEHEGKPMAWIKRYIDDNIFVFHLFAPQNISDDQIMDNITKDMSRLGATKLTLVDSRRWPFFPHVDSYAIREDHFFQRASNLQGQNNTVFVNEALGMSTMPASAAQGKKAAQRLASGEY